MKRILLYLNPFRFRMLVGFIVKVTGTMAELILPYILTHILENVIVEQNVAKVVFYGAVMIFFGIIACLGNIIANRMAARVTTDFSKEMRDYAYKIHGKFPYIVDDMVNLKKYFANSKPVSTLVEVSSLVKKGCKIVFFVVK